MYKKVEESQTLLINTQSAELMRQNKKIIRFGFGQSPFLPPSVVLNEFKNKVHHKEYTSVQGDLELRRLMSKFHKDHNGLDVLPENILLASGSKSLLFTALMALDKADVFIPAPSWVSYAPQAQLCGHHIIRLKTSFEERWRITPAVINDSIRLKKHHTSVLILNYPGNPDGLTYSEEEIIQLAHVARSHNILVISDEIYGLLTYNDEHVSFANHYPERTITTTGISKWCGAGGWRLGAAFLYNGIEPQFKQALTGIASETYSCAPAPVQMASKVLYESYDGIVKYLEYQTNILSTIGHFCTEKLKSLNIKVHQPEGGFYIFPDFSFYKARLNDLGIYTSTQFCQQLLNDTGVATLPGSAFGFEESHFVVRIAFVDFEEPGMNNNFDINLSCPKVVDGMNKICQWVEAI